MRNRRLKIFFDGGCRPNPGAMETAVVVRGVTHYRGDLGHGTNNDAEWLALIHAVTIARALDLPDCELLGDSALIVNQANGVWKCRGSDLKRHLQTFQALRIDAGALRIKQIARSQNLAGIALDQRHDASRGHAA